MSESVEVFPEITHIVTCHTEGCENEGLGIEFKMPYSWLICGPCGNDIIDIVPPIPEGRDEYLDRLNGFA